MNHTKLNILKKVSDILEVLKKMEKECKTEEDKKALERFKSVFLEVGETIKDV